MSATEAQVRAALGTVVEPELGRDPLSLGMISNVAVKRSKVQIAIREPLEGYRAGDELARRVVEAVEAVDGVGSVALERSPMTDPEREALRRQLLGDPESTAGTNDAHGHAEGRAVPFAEAGSTTRVLLIASGKGGVGKSSVSANLAIALAQRGKRVAIVDADVWGFSIPRMLGVNEAPLVIDRMLVPPAANGVRCISMGFFAEEDTPVIWRGPMLHKALEQFLTDVWWDEPDFLVVDLPPGTGDIAISMAQFLPRAEVFVVTTPQPAAQRVAQRAAFMADKVDLEVRGVIENMSWFTGDDGTRYDLFGSGGGKELADRLDVPLVGQVPLVPALRDGSDRGRPIVAVEPDSDVAGIFATMAERIDTEMAPTKRYHPELKVI